jgi:hypothetical protein
MLGCAGFAIRRPYIGSRPLRYCKVSMHKRVPCNCLIPPCTTTRTEGMSVYVARYTWRVCIGCMFGGCVPDRRRSGGQIPLLGVINRSHWSPRPGETSIRGTCVGREYGTGPVVPMGALGCYVLSAECNGSFRSEDAVPFPHP